MDTLFALLKKTMVATIFMVFAFVATYVPHQWNKVEHTEAAFGLEVTQLVNVAKNSISAIKNTITAAKTTVIAWATSALQSKEWVLDGIAWAVAKQIVRSMVNSLVNWINSGFEGRPMFVTNLKRHLLEAADQAIGEYIAQEISSFVCSPFQLQVRMAIDLQYQNTRINQPAPTCTLTGIIDNITSFTDGAQGSFNAGGWNDWFDITSSPEQYTPYGAALAAQTGAEIRILNARGEEATKIGWGDGFLSGEICRMVSGPNGATEDCFISKPGKIIEEALSFNLDSGREALITADEINEIIAALLGQLANKALTGAAGLLGLSGGTGYTYAGYAGGSYLNAMSLPISNVPSAENILQLAQSAVSFETTFQGILVDYQKKFAAIIADPTAPAAQKIEANTELIKIAGLIGATGNNVIVLNNIIGDLEANPGNVAVANASVATYSGLTLHTSDELTELIAEWEEVIREDLTTP
ncbi:MAG: hypothetical protein KC877_01165 [Candidatus Kaiserbacteria bacterium]|nr:hypothetical protein [Candidatus Kaiserbacteria bacterium]MCB9816513.1 hypothetical protein [Candidatus Nomurabacteria bacterium]